jgi:hypothetical protein
MKVKKCDKKKTKLPLTSDDSWRGLGTKTPPTRAHYLSQHRIEYFPTMFQILL